MADADIDINARSTAGLAEEPDLRRLRRVKEENPLPGKQALGFHCFWDAATGSMVLAHPSP
jgi:hypothetical protein